MCGTYKRLYIEIGNEWMDVGLSSLNRRWFVSIAVGFVVSIAILAALAPAQSVINFGRWRDINPAQYSADVAGTLRGVYVRNGGTGGIGAGDGWAVGGDSGLPIIAHYDGFSWELRGSPVSGAVYNSVHFCTTPGAPGVGLCSPNGDGTDGWIVGAAAGAAVAVYVSNPFALTPVSVGLSPATNLTSVFMVCHSPPYGTGCPGALAAGLTYAAGQSGGNAVIYAFNGNPLSPGGWTVQFTSALTTKFNSIYMFWDGSALGGFAVGNSGVVARLNSGTWTEAKLTLTTPDLLGVFVDNGNPIDAWAVGRSGQIWHFATGFWSGPATPFGTASDLVSVFLTSTSEGWIIGTGSITLHSTNLGSGNVWLSLTSPLQTATGSGIDLLSASFPGGGNGWSVGTEGVILHTENSNCGPVPGPCWGGSTSITQSLTGVEQLKAVFMKGSNDAWAGGLFDTTSNNPALIHWDGNKWHRATVSAGYSVTQPDIWGIFMLSSSEGWAVGGNRADTAPSTLKWDGNTWTSQPVAACTCSLRSVFMISGGTGGDGWAAGTGGNIFRYQSGSWLLFTTIAGNPQLNSVFISNPGSSQNAGWAVGNGGKVLKLQIVSGVPTWSSVGPILGVTADLFGVFFTDSNHGWIVGGTPGGQEAVILTTTDGGNNWSGGAGQVTGAPAGTVLRSVFIDSFGTGSGNGDGWAVGNTNVDDRLGNAVFAHWDGGGWTAVTISPGLAGGIAAFGLALRSVYLTSPTDGFAVGAGVAGAAAPLSGIFHLDPPNPPVFQQTQTSNTISSTSTSVATSNTGTTSSVTGSTESSMSTSTQTGQTGTSSVTSQGSTSTISSGVVTTTSQSTTTSITAPLVLPAIPGFPWESILAGIILGIAVLGIIRRRRRPAHSSQS